MTVSEGGNVPEIEKGCFGDLIEFDLNHNDLKFSTVLYINIEFTHNRQKH